jgi:hypothetical protein
LSSCIRYGYAEPGLRSAAVVNAVSAMMMNGRS